MEIGAFLAGAWKEIIATAGAIITGAIILKAKDFIICKIITMINPEKYINMVIAKVDSYGDDIVKKIELLDKKYIDPMKKTSPKAGALLETTLANSLKRLGKTLKADLDEAAKGILDK